MLLPYEFNRSLAGVSAMYYPGHLLVADDGQLAAVERGCAAGLWMCFQSQLVRRENTLDRNGGVAAWTDLTGHVVTGLIQRRFA